MRIGTRGSALALAQARFVAGLLEAHLAGSSAHAGSPANAGFPANAGSAAHPAHPVEVVTIATAGDRGEHAADKSRWTGALEAALARGEIDLAVHSAKDVPGELAGGLALLGAPARAAAEDALCGAAGLEDLRAGARVATSSIRRAAQLRAAREDLEVVTVRGNVDTRLRKLDEGGFDALVLARAGLQRLGREQAIGATLDPARFVPSPGQGTLALQGRAEDAPTRTAVEAITDTKAFASLRAERAMARALGASCNTPLGAYAADAGCGCLHLRAWVGLPDGSTWVSDELLGGFYDPEQLGQRMAERMVSAGAGELLSAAERHAPSAPASANSEELAV